MLISYDILPGDAIVFIYQADKNMPDELVATVDKKIDSFIAEWTSHQVPVKAFGKVYHNRFIVLFADEFEHGVSGCSKDKVTHFVREIAEQNNFSFFDRMNAAYLDEAGIVSTLHLREIAENYDVGQLKRDTIFFNNLVHTKKDWEEKWQQALQDSPFSRYIVQKAD